MLARMVDGGARKKAQRLRFKAFQDPVKFLDSSKGIQYTEKLRNSNKSYHVTVTEALAADLPTLPR
eukprot:3412199-Pyramimonas_sp.AAC.1